MTTGPFHSSMTSRMVFQSAEASHNSAISWALVLYLLILRWPSKFPNEIFCFRINASFEKFQVQVGRANTSISVE